MEEFTAGCFLVVDGCFFVFHHLVLQHHMTFALTVKMFASILKFTLHHHFQKNDSSSWAFLNASFLPSSCPIPSHTISIHSPVWVTLSSLWLLLTAHLIPYALSVATGVPTSEHREQRTLDTGVRWYKTYRNVPILIKTESNYFSVLGDSVVIEWITCLL